MRMHIEMDEELVRRIDQIAGARRRSDFVRRAVEAALVHHERWDLVQSARGAIPDEGHEWDDDPATWVRRQRRGDRRRLG